MPSCLQKWQEVNDSKWNKLTLFISSMGTKPVLTALMYTRILARSRTANIASHAAGNCPAKTCTNCNKKNHLAKVCRSTPKQSNEKPKKKSKDERQRVNQLNENGASDEPDSDESIFSLQSPRQKKKYITEILVIPNKTEDNILIKFQVDTGASCSTITLKDYKKITHETLEKSNVKLKLYDQSLIQPTGSKKLYCTASGMRNC